MGDKFLGLLLLLTAGFVFVYYTVWVLVLVSCQMTIEIATFKSEQSPSIFTAAIHRRARSFKSFPA